MTHRILPPAVERFEIHNAVCRARRQGLACSTCSDLYERAAAANRWGACRACGAEDYLIGGRCEPCRVGEAA
jgi:hypothetical protein